MELANVFGHINWGQMHLRDYVWPNIVGYILIWLPKYRRMNWTKYIWPYNYNHISIEPTMIELNICVSKELENWFGPINWGLMHLGVYVWQNVFGYILLRPRICRPNNLVKYIRPHNFNHVSIKPTILGKCIYVNGLGKCFLPYKMGPIAFGRLCLAKYSWVYTNMTAYI
jgi:hypothetical protein